MILKRKVLLMERERLSEIKLSMEEEKGFFHGGGQYFVFNVFREPKESRVKNIKL